MLETLRLEDMERRRRSLRTEPLVLTYRNTEPEPGAAAAAVGALSQLPGALSGLDQLLGAVQSPQAGFPAGAPENAVSTASDFSRIGHHTQCPGTRRGPSPRRPPRRRGLLPSLLPWRRPIPNLPSSTERTDPDDWDRIFEGSFLEAVLVTQLSGEFPGPVLANVSVPFYSADRQRVLIPRGARVVGTVQAVSGADQERLAVAFHRIIWPDGRAVSLQFNGLNQVGEGALKDEVDRHYFSMFAAAGAVGILSGLTAIGSDPFAGGRQGFQAGASQGLGEGAVQILDRFLNRLPTITIRAGHRLRIWFTGDVLVPPEA